MFSEPQMVHSAKAVTPQHAEVQIVQAAGPGVPPTRRVLVATLLIMSVDKNNLTSITFHTESDAVDLRECIGNGETVTIILRARP